MSENVANILTESQRRNAQRQLRKFFWLNGVAVGCVMDNVLLLWALHNGLSESHVAMLSSFTLLAMPMMFLGKRLSATIGATRAMSLTWFTRYGFVIAMLPAPCLHGGPLEPLLPWLFTVCVLGLFALRSVGMVNTIPIMGEVTTREDQGSFQASTALYANLAYLLTMTAIILVLRRWNTLVSYQGILLVGSLVGMASAGVLRRLPEMGRLRVSARIGLPTVVRHIRNDLVLRRLALSWCTTLGATALIVPIAMLAVKRGYNVSDDAALFFTLLELVGAVLAAYAMSIIADHTGPRPILTLGLGMLTLTTAFWALAPARFFPAAVGAAFLLGGIGRHGIVLALNHYLLASTSSKERVGVSLTLQMLSGGMAGLAGMLIAGGTIRWLSKRMSDGGGLELYQNYYRLVLLLLVPVMLSVLRLPKLNNWSVHNVIGLIFSLRDLRALISLNALKRRQNSGR